MAERQRVPTTRAVADHLARLNAAREAIDREAAIYLAGVCAAIDVDVTTVVAVDSDDPALLVELPDPEPDPTSPLEAVEAWAGG